MADLADHEERIEHLEKIIAQTGLGYGQYFPGSLQVCMVDKDGDGDFDPYTSTSWDGDSFSTSTGTIDWNGDFGVPDSARMVFIDLQCRDSDSSNTTCEMKLKAKSTTTKPALASGNLKGSPDDRYRPVHGWVPIAQDGTSYYTIVATGSGTFDVRILVTAYAR